MGFKLNQVTALFENFFLSFFISFVHVLNACQEHHRRPNPRSKSLEVYDAHSESWRECSRAFIPSAFSFVLIFRSISTLYPSPHFQDKPHSSTQLLRFLQVCSYNSPASSPLPSLIQIRWQQRKLPSPFNFENGRAWNCVLNYCKAYSGSSNNQRHRQEFQHIRGRMARPWLGNVLCYDLMAFEDEFALLLSICFGMKENQAHVLVSNGLYSSTSIEALGTRKENADALMFLECICRDLRVIMNELEQKKLLTPTNFEKKRLLVSFFNAPFTSSSLASLMHYIWMFSKRSNSRNWKPKQRRQNLNSKASYRLPRLSLFRP